MQLNSQSNNSKKKSTDTAINDRKKNIITTQKVKDYSIDNKSYSDSLLKIKLKSKINLDLQKMKDNIIELEDSFIKKDD